MTALAIKTARNLVHLFHDESDDLRMHPPGSIDVASGESWLRLAIDAFRWLTRADQAIRSAVYRRNLPFDLAVEEGLKFLCAQWLRSAGHARQWLARQEQKLSGSVVEEFLNCCEEMEAIVEAQRGVEAEELPDALVKLQDSALDDYRGGQTSEFV